MAVGFPEVEALATQKPIDFAVRLSQCLNAPVFETHLHDPFQNSIERRIADAEAIVVNWDAALVGSGKARLDKVDGQRVVNVNAGALCMILAPLRT